MMKWLEERLLDYFSAKNVEAENQPSIESSKVVGRV